MNKEKINAGIDRMAKEAKETMNLLSDKIDRATRCGNEKAARIKRSAKAGLRRTTDAVQVRALEKVLADLGAEPCVEHSNPSVYATVLSDGTQGALFLINLYTGAQESEVKVHFNGEIKELGHIRLKPSEVKFIRF